MKNIEGYEHKILNHVGNWCSGFIEPVILKDCFGTDCENTGCTKCHMLQILWAMKKYKLPEDAEVDWSKVAVDTPILVRDTGLWVGRRFAKYENGTVYSWGSDETSHSPNATMYGWKFARLPKVGQQDTAEDCEPTVDWSKVAVDTPVLVSDDNVKWVKGHFGSYHNGRIFAWAGGQTSKTTGVWNP